VTWDLYIRLSGMMFLEYAVWGAWMPVLAARLLGPLKMSGKQTGWIYATLPLASMISPLIVGQLADSWFDTGWILAVAHLIGAALLFLSAKQTKFNLLFVVMLLYSLCYGATIPLVNALMFRHLTDADTQAPTIFIWAPVAWALVGYFLTGLRQFARKDGDGSDCLYLAAILSVAMCLMCILQPATPPQAQQGQPMMEALSMLKDFHYLVFMLVSLCVAGTMQFYFLGTSQFMQDMHVNSKNVPAFMAIAQAVQALATLFALGWLLTELGPKWTLTVGTFCWVLLYGFYMIGKPRWIIIGGQGLHGLAYVFFIIAGQIYVKMAAPSNILGSAQSLIILVTTGIGLFLGTQLAGLTMEKFTTDGKFLWPKVWIVPFCITLAGAIALALLF
jgi:nucleoside transporter